MKKWIGLFSLTAAVIGMTGCSMCCGPYDYDYPTFGGKHERVNSNWGRVGSVFSDPMAAAGGPSADSNLEPPPTPRKNEFDDDFDLDDLQDQIKSELEGGQDIDQMENINPLPENSTPGPDAGSEKTTFNRLLKNRLRQGAWR